MKKYILLVSIFLLPLYGHAATIDGVVSKTEYQWNTDGNEGSDKWETFRRGGNANNEYDDASGGNRWDINYLGTDISEGQFQFGAIGGKILSGRQTGSGNGTEIYLSDMAIGFNTSSNPTVDSSGFQYAVRLDEVNDSTGIAYFSLLSGGTWEGANIYGYESKHKTATYKMVDATETREFTGKWDWDGKYSDGSMLEANFDLNWLSLFDLDKGGRLSTYLTMACVNDEVLVHGDVSPVPLPAAAWLFGPALLGFMGLRRRG